jgi:hypothetical protein
MLGILTVSQVTFNYHSPIHEKTSNSIGSLKDCDKVTGSVELVSGGETSRSRANDGNLLASPRGRWSWHHPTLLESLVDDGALDRLDTDGCFVDTQDTC